MHCTQCGKPIDNDAKFCPHCGARVAAEAAASPPSSPPPAARASGSPGGAAAGGGGASPGSGAANPGGATSSGSGAANPGGGAAPGSAGADFGRAASDAAAAASAALSRVDGAGILARVKAILLSPRTEWPVIEAEQKKPADIWMGYVLPLVALSAICGALGMMFIGISVPVVGRIRSGAVAGIGGAVLNIVMTFVAVFVVAWIVNWLAPKFGGQQDRLRALKVVAYSSTAAWVAGVLTLLPALAFIAMLVSLYSFYLLYLGLPVMMRAPREKALGYTVVVVLCAIVAMVLVGLVVSVLSATLGLRTPGLSGGQLSHGGSDDQTAAVLSNMFGGKTDADKARVKDAMSQLTQMGKDVEAAEKAARAAGQDPNAAAANAIDLGKVLNATGAVVAGGKDVQPVDFHALKDMLPASVDGLAQHDAEGQAGEAAGMKGSSASARYGTGNGSADLRLEIADMGSLSGLAGIAARFNPKVEKETSDGYERTRTVDGRIVHERYNRTSKSGEFGVMVGNRFLVTARGENVGESTLEAAVKSVDVVKLAALAK